MSDRGTRAQPVDPPTAPDRPVTPRRETFADDGVDVSLVRWMLGLSPAQRLDALQNAVAAILELRGERRGA